MSFFLSKQRQQVTVPRATKYSSCSMSRSTWCGTTCWRLWVWNAFRLHIHGSMISWAQFWQFKGRKDVTLEKNAFLIPNKTDLFQQTCCSRIARIGVAQLGSDPGSGRYGTPAVASRNEKENDFSCRQWGSWQLDIWAVQILRTATCVPKIHNWKQNETKWIQMGMPQN